MQQVSEIPVLDLSPEIEFLWDELNTAFQRVLRSGIFIMGEDVSIFESEFAAYLNVKHAIAVNSGTDALVIGLRALNIGVGDEVITTSFTFFATAEAIETVGASPIFVDIDAQTLNLDITQVEERITARTKAILPVHLYGHPVDIDPLAKLAEKYEIKIIEDVAQSLGGEYKGKKLGTFGDVAAFSFFPSKNLGAYGDGGLLVTDDDMIAQTAQMLRVHGARKKYHNEILGYNSRLDSLQAAILRVKLPHVENWNNARRLAASRYHELLRGISEIVLPFEAPYARHVYHQYTVRVLSNKRDKLKSFLQQQGIQTMVYYPMPVHQLPYYRKQTLSLMAAEKAADEVLSLPLWPQIQIETQQAVVNQIATFFGGNA
ncbi:MAG: DegT/DnrJ/EryC1/StrS family aminotransferase [Chloroflexi bacterium]|nr:DegT/DnrJ/EryC1/StrS family aminotransferase [Chloroflexota bacterium]